MATKERDKSERKGGGKGGKSDEAARRGSRTPAPAGPFPRRACATTTARP